MNNQTQQMCCPRHEEMLAREASLLTMDQKFDAWIEQHCSDGSKHDENDIEPQPTGYYYHGTCVGAHENHSQGYASTCDHCHMEATIRRSLKVLGLNDLARWRRNKN